MTEMNGPMTGLRKAAVLLVQMSREDSARVLSQMRESEVEELTSEIARLGAVEAGVADGVLAEFHTLATTKTHAGGLDFARELLEASLGAERAAEIVGKLSISLTDMPFGFLNKAEPRQVLSFVQNEHPQTIPRPSRWCWPTCTRAWHRRFCPGSPPGCSPMWPTGSR
jgi:flagellar motor switch protein FliG